MSLTRLHDCHLPPLPPVVDIVLVVVIVLVVSLAHVVMVRGVGVPIVRRVEAVPEVVEMLAVGIHQSLQRARVHWRHHLNISVNNPQTQKYPPTLCWTACVVSMCFLRLLL